MIREVQEGDVQALMARVRPADVAWAEALFGEGKTESAVQDSINGSVLCWTLVFEGQVAAIFGVAPVSLMGRDGLPWLIGTDLIEKHAGMFMKLSRQYIPRMAEVCPRLVNVVDVRNKRSIRWLKAMGFTLLDPIPVGASQLPFHPFFKES